MLFVQYNTEILNSLCARLHSLQEVCVRPNIFLPVCICHLSFIDAVVCLCVLGGGRQWVLWRVTLLNVDANLENYRFPRTCASPLRTFIYLIMYNFFVTRNNMCCFISFFLCQSSIVYYYCF